MVWPFTSASGKGGKDDKEDELPRRPVSWTDSLNGTDWQHYKDPRNWVPTLLVTTTVLASLQIYRSYLRRIPGATHIQPSFFRKRSLFGRVTSVGDGDNFHLYHTPGGRLAGWGWLRRVPVKKPELKNKTVSHWIWPLIVYFPWLTPTMLDPHPYRRNRRTRRRSFWATRSAILDRCFGLACKLYTWPKGASEDLQA